MAEATIDNAGTYTPVTTNTIAGPIFIQDIDWYGGAIADGSTIAITGIEVQKADGATKGDIWSYEAEADDRPYSKYIGKAYREILVTVSAGTVKIHTRPYNSETRHHDY